ncbi:MAG: AlwI family type II restriction endonuclease [Gordonia sp. (in: high G+C Gram-positive bacteria)]|uniref:AlwI family type II restriction endonuclease n=1 Tax=Gordonia sp. (in: high G+C Gram-positive bacteria) TaxID=84139 RepID=UPI0039E3D156
MTPPRAKSLVHLGDTSFRRKDVIAGYHAMLEALAEFRSDDERPWDPVTQAEFYHLLRGLAPDVFGSGTAIAEADAAKRARTYTSALVKLGFVDEHERRITALGELFSGGDRRRLDRFDRLCALTPENSAVLRGVLSYTEKTDRGDRYFPVRLLLRVLHRTGPLSTDEFAFAFIAGPKLIGVDVEALVAAITDMRARGATLDTALGAAERTLEQDRYIISGVFTPEAFPNGKGPTFVERYRAFLLALTDFREHPDAGTLARLRRAVADGGATVKARFDPARYLPDLRKSGNGPLTVYRSACYPSWDGDVVDFRQGIVDLFNGSRITSLVREYLDNDLRILTASGVFSVSEDRVSAGAAYAGEFFAAVDDRLVVLSDVAPDDARRAAGVAESCGPDALARTDARIVARHGIAPDEIQEFVEARERARFDRVVASSFPAGEVRRLLGLIADDYRSAAVNTVREKAFRGKPTVPCMYEYLVGLSLYYAADRAFDPRAAFGLSLDGDFLPISHAPGLRGDIEFVLDGRRVLVEVTLMDPATQRRGELEPVLRHATNLAGEFPDDEVITLFIANEVDPNVARIFGFARVMAMAPTDGGTGTASPLIVSLRTRDWIEIATAPLSSTLDQVAAEAGRTEVEYLNSDWNAELVDRLVNLQSFSVPDRPAATAER